MCFFERKVLFYFGASFFKFDFFEGIFFDVFFFFECFKNCFYVLEVVVVGIIFDIMVNNIVVYICICMRMINVVY